VHIVFSGMGYNGDVELIIYKWRIKMQLPNEIVLLLSAGIGYLVTNGLKGLFPKWEISGSAAQITAALVTCMVALANQGLALVPPEYQQITLTVFTLIVSVLGAFGVHYAVAKFSAKG